MDILAIDADPDANLAAALGIEGLQHGLLLPTANHIPDPEFADIDFVPNTARRQTCELFLSNAFGFGGTNASIIVSKYKDS